MFLKQSFNADSVPFNYKTLPFAFSFAKEASLLSKAAKWQHEKTDIQGGERPSQQQLELKFQPRPRYLSPLSTHALYVSQCTVVLVVLQETLRYDYRLFLSKHSRES